jgi:hypothetical protein
MLMSWNLMPPEAFSILQEATRNSGSRSCNDLARSRTGGQAHKHGMRGPFSA